MNKILSREIPDHNQLLPLLKYCKFSCEPHILNQDL